MKYVCKHHFIELDARDMNDGKPYGENRRRFHCKKCKKFVFKNEIVELDNQWFDILQQLNYMDIYLGKIWEIAFQHPVYPKLEKGIPEHNLGDLFIKLHECQRSIAGWETMSQWRRS